MAEVPFADYNQGFSSPHFKETHLQFRAKVRAFVESELKPFLSEWEEKGTYPPDIHKKAYDAGIYSAVWPKEYGGTPPEDFDAFHDFILIDELARCGAGGVVASAFFSFNIALPPVLAAGSDFLKNLVAKDVIEGRKIMALCVSEPYAGSDVANLRSTAE
eukprot:gene29424-36645_t